MKFLTTIKNKIKAYVGNTIPPVIYQRFGGDKFEGGYGPTELLYIDYWTLRKRSAALFTNNLYARGLIRRLLTNEINTGLTLESTPDSNIVGLSEEQVNDWTDEIESRFELWSLNARMCDYRGLCTFSELQREARLEALISGDVLVVMRQNKQTNLPQVELINANRVRSPYDQTVREGHQILHGVELDKKRRHVAYWIRNLDGTEKRIPCYGEKSGRKLAWLVYGTEKRLNAVRGEPLLSLILQSLKEIDRYRDAAQRKAILNATLAMFIEKTEDKPGTLPLTGGAIRRDSLEVTDQNGATRDMPFNGTIPGLVLEELQTGEKPVAFGSAGTDINFAAFEASIVNAIAWANEIPAEVLTLAFQNNYSASQAAINEFKMYLNKVRDQFGTTFCKPIYQEWLVSETLLQNVNAPGFLESWRDQNQYDVFGSWISSDWSGAIKPSTDIKKQAQGYKLLNDECWITNDRASKELTGTKFSKNVKRVKRENELKIEAARPIAEFRQEFGDDIANSALEAIDEQKIRLIVNNEIEGLENVAS